MTPQVAERTTLSSGYMYPVASQEIDIHESTGYRTPSNLSDGDRRSNSEAAVARAAARKPIVEYVRRLLLQMGEQGDTGLGYDRIHLLCRLIDRISTERTVFPAITPDNEGGVSFEWSSGDMVIEVAVESAGEYSLVSEGVGSASTHLAGHVHDLPLETLKVLVEQFSDLVTERNPDWRQHY